MTDFTTNDMVITLVIIAVCVMLYYLPKTDWWRKHICDVFPHEDPCFMCNLANCEGCVVKEVKSAYIQKQEYGKVVATATLTFKEDFVVAQSPAGGDERWELPNFVGCYKTEVKAWADKATAVEPRFATFS